MQLTLNEYLKMVLNYLQGNPLIAVFLCLGLGYLVGNKKIGSFSLGATASTLIIGICLALTAKHYVGSFLMDSSIKNCFFAMFAFTLGYDVGPAFFRAIRSSGIRVVLLAVIHAVCTCGFIWLACALFGFHADEGVGLLAGAFTTSAAVGASDGKGSATLIYSLTYSFGTISAIVFVRFIAPKLLGIRLLEETKRHLDRLSGKEPDTVKEDNGIYQIRALKVLPEGACAGKTVEQLEKPYDFRMEIETICRNAQRLPGKQTEILQPGDVLTVIGSIEAISDFDDQGLQEVTDPQYFQVNQRTGEIVLTTGSDSMIRSCLTNFGILILNVVRGGKPLNNPQKAVLQQGDILEVSGPESAVEEAAKTFGYFKDNGITTDIPFFAFAIAVGLMIASVKFLIKGKVISLGVSFGTLILGLLCGWWYDRKPKRGYIADSTRWFIRSIGLNIYIAIVGLTSEITLENLLSWKSLLYIAVGIGLTMLVRTVTLLLGKYLLKLSNIDLIGGICGSATSTPALNALTEYTGSSVFALSYAPGYAVGNVLLILVGAVLPNLIS